MPETKENETLSSLLESYGFLREEIITRIQLDNKRFTRGLLAVAAVIGYGLVSSKNQWIVALSPFILGFLYLEHLRSRNQIAAIANHLIDIENEMSGKETLFRWEKAYGGYFNGDSVELFSWRRVPSYLMGVGAILAYVFLVYLSVTAWPSNPLFFSGLTKTNLITIYIIHFAVLLIAVIAHLKYLQSLI